VIAVAPDSYNKFLGSKYTNSSVTGNWEDFITQDVVHYVDTHFRTLATRESRGIAGISMGGYGALKIAMKHPDLFCAVYSVNGAYLVFEQDYLITEKEALIEASQQKNFSLFSGLAVLSAVASAPAFAPNPSALPFFGDFPITESGDLIDSTWERWLQHDPFTLLSSHKNNLIQLSAIRFDCGKSDIYFSSNTVFSNALSELGIDHTFLSYEGDHTNKVDQRMKSEVFPFFSEYLETSVE